MKAFSIKSGVLQINGAEVTGLASGDDVIIFEPFADAVTPDIGADGHAEAAINASQAGTVTIRTQHTSDINRIFQNFFNDQIVNGDSFATLNGSYRFSNGTSYTLAGGVLTKQAPVGLGEHASPREWEFFFELMIFNQENTSALFS
jgi:hypothetical protein